MRFIDAYVMLKVLLYPFAVVYNVVTRLRNYQYDTGSKPAATFDLPVIVVGNLTTGGTGKTPMIEYLVRLLTPVYITAVLSRGYGRSTKGLRFAGQLDSADTLGDEPFQFYKKFGDKVTITVAEDRAFAIPNILQENTETQVILMDDGFQHRRVKPSFSILLSDYNRPFYSDLLLPAGRLRESRSAASRADVVVVTKCPADLSEPAAMDIEKQIRDYAEKPVFFSTIHYGTPVSFGRECPLSTKVILLTGIAHAGPLKKYIEQHYTLVEHIRHGDHHHYTQGDVEALVRRVSPESDVCILTTEKDMVKLNAPIFRQQVDHLPIFYLPIEVDFLKNGKDFDEIVLNAAKRVS